MSKTYQDYIDVLNDTIKHYRTDDNKKCENHEGKCVYSSSDHDNNCALGRYMTDEAKDILRDNVSATAHSLKEEGKLEQYLKPEYRGFKVDFWKMLQNLHDSEKMWDIEYSFGRHIEYVKNEIKLLT